MNLTQDEIKSIRFDIAFEKKLLLDLNKSLLNINESPFRESDLRSMKRQAESKIQRLEKTIK